MKSLKQNYDKHLIVTLIVLVGLPILLGFSTYIHFHIDETIIFFIDFFNDSEIGYSFLDSLVLLQYVVLICMFILYPVYPSIFSIEKHLNKRNPKVALTEYQFLKKIIYPLLPFFIFTIALKISSGITGDPLNVMVQFLLPEPWYSSFLSVLAATLFTFASASLRVVLLGITKNFNFYLARLSFRAMSRVEDEVERMKFLIGGLGFYNKYIRRALGIEINDLKIIYSRIISDTAVDKNHSMKELCKAFEDKHDKLIPIRCMTTLFDDMDPAHFLVKESVGKKLGARLTFVGTVLSAITAVIGSIDKVYSLIPR
jgi:hypothetical protein